MNSNTPLLLLFTVLAFVLITSAFLIPGPLQREAYMGSEYCGSCHQSEYNAWSSSAHAKAFVHMPSDKKPDRAAAFEKYSSFFASVQCESCHGPGKYYALPHAQKDKALSKLLYMQEPTRTCIQCHANNSELAHVSKKQKFDHATSTY